jgi:hypothetical protein
MTWDTVAYTVLNRVLLGFAITLSGWQVDHLGHGAIVGLVVSFSVSLGSMFSDPGRFAACTSAGALNGLLNE